MTSFTEMIDAMYTTAYLEQASPEQKMLYILEQPEKFSDANLDWALDFEEGMRYE